MFDYMYEDDVQVMQMIYIPKRLFSSPAYSKLSAKAKVLYALLLGSSEREGMTKPLYSDYSIREICDDLCCSSMAMIIRARKHSSDIEDFSPLV